MKKYLTRSVVLILSLVMVFTMEAAPAAYALTAGPAFVKAQSSDGSRASAGTSKLKGENSFSSMLLKAADEENETGEEAGSNGQQSINTVSGVDIKEKKATVELCVDRSAEMVVGIYADVEEGTAKLLGSGETLVDTDMTSTDIEINIDSMPETYLVKVYLMDPDSHEPLNDAFVDRSHTAMVQELEAKTMDDYDPEKIVDLDTEDDSRKNNFAVAGDNTGNFRTEGGKNEVISADEENGVYVIGNASTEFMDLKKDDSFVLTSGDNQIIAGEVDTISIDGSTVTITIKDDSDITDIFEIVKIDGTAKEDDCEFEPSQEAIDQGYEITTGKNTSGKTLDADIDTEFGFEITLHNKEKKLPNDEAEDNYIKFFREMTIKVMPSIKGVISFGYQHIDIEIPLDVTGKIGVEAKGTIPLMDFPGIGFLSAYIGCVKFGVGLTPEFSVTGSIEASFTCRFGCKITIDSEAKKRVNVSTIKEVKSIQGEAKVTIFIGFRVAPYVALISKRLGKVEISQSVGTVITFADTVDLMDKTVHTCGKGKCIDGSIDIEAELSAEGKLFSKKIEFTLAKQTWHLKDFYISLKYGDHGWGRCPHKYNLINLSVVDSKKKPVADVEITVTGAKNRKAVTLYEQAGGNVSKIEPSTDYKGNAEFLINDGKFNLNAVCDGYRKFTKVFHVDGGGKELEIILYKESEEPPEVPDPDVEDTVYFGRYFQKELNEDTDEEEIEYLNTVYNDEDEDEKYGFSWDTVAGVPVAYKSDNNLDDHYYKAEPIAWKVIDKEAGKLILFATDVLELRSFGSQAWEDGETVGWKNSELRKWLNSDFCDIAFTQEERQMLISKERNYKSLQFNEEDGYYDTTESAIDSVWLLDEHEVQNEAYGFSSSPSASDTRVAYATSYVDSERGAMSWYLSGDPIWDYYNSMTGVYVDTDGSIDKTGGEDEFGIRPVIMVDPSAVSTEMPETPVIKKTGASSAGSAVKKNLLADISSGEITTADYSEASDMRYALNGTDNADDTARTESFTDLTPGVQYIVAAVKDAEADVLMDPDNLLYITQETVADDGTLSVSYIPREATESWVALAFGKRGTDISSLDIDMTQDLTCTETLYRPKVVITDGDKILEEEIDYVITGETAAAYQGSYTVTITGKGDYHGTIVKTYTISKTEPLFYAYNTVKTLGNKPFPLDLLNTGDGDVRYSSSNSKVVTIDEDGMVTIKGVGKALIRAVLSETATYEGAKTSCYITVKPKKTAIVKYRNIKGRKIALKWRTVKGVNGYKIQYGLKKSFKGSKSITIKKAKIVSRTLRRLKKKKTYYIRIRTFKKVNGVTYWSYWSKVKRVKIRK